MPDGALLAHGPRDAHRALSVVVWGNCASKVFLAAMQKGTAEHRASQHGSRVLGADCGRRHGDRAVCSGGCVSCCLVPQTVAPDFSQGTLSLIVIRAYQNQALLAGRVLGP